MGWGVPTPVFQNLPVSPLVNEANFYMVYMVKCDKICYRDFEADISACLYIYIDIFGSISLPVMKI